MPVNFKKSENIGEVIDRLSHIVEQAKRRGNRAGYFAALYRQVTVRVKQDILSGRFEDNARMEELDMIFADRYLEALDNYHNNRPVTQAWALAFDTTARWPPIVLQHLLLGMHAHISLDLGIAAAETMAGQPLDDLKNDFNVINDILASLVDEVQVKLAQVWPLLKRLDQAAGPGDETLSKLALISARDQAWRVACELHALGADRRAGKIQEVDQRVVNLSRRIILSQHFGVRILLLLVRIGERGSIEDIIEMLD